MTIRCSTYRCQLNLDSPRKWTSVCLSVRAFSGRLHEVGRSTWGHGNAALWTALKEEADWATNICFWLSSWLWMQREQLPQVLAWWLAHCVRRTLKAYAKRSLSSLESLLSGILSEQWETQLTHDNSTLWIPEVILMLPGKIEGIDPR